MTVVMSREEHDRMLRKSGLMAPSGFHDAKTVRDQAAEPLPEPPKPTFAQAQVKPPVAQAQPQATTPAPAVPEPTEKIVFADLKKEIEGIVFQTISVNKGQLQGPQGVPGKDVNVADLKSAIEKIIDQKLDAIIATIPERFRGPAGRDGKDSTVPGPAGPVGPVGPAGKDSTVPGPAGKTIVVEKPVKGDKGDKGDAIPGPRGPSGLDEKQITDLVCTILTNANAVSEQTLKLIAVTMELDSIETDPKYHRLGVVRNEIVNRLKEKLL